MWIRRPVARGQLAVGAAMLCFTLGAGVVQHSISRQLAGNEARIRALREEMDLRLQQIPLAGSNSVGSEGSRESRITGTAGVEEIKRELQKELGLLPVRLLRERAQSFVELSAWDNHGNSNYATAGYLGNGYFLTVKHAVVPLADGRDVQGSRRITRITVRYRNQDLRATIVDAGDAPAAVHTGDWAILKVRREIGLAPLPLNTAFSFEFATPVVRLGNDYSRGIVLSSGYIGRRTADGLVTCLTDGHPGASGGGVLDQQGTLVGMPIGRMRDDYRFSFLLPLRPEMFRRVPGVPGLEEIAAPPIE